MELDWLLCVPMKGKSEGVKLESKSQRVVNLLSFHLHGKQKTNNEEEVQLKNPMRANNYPYREWSNKRLLNT